MRSPAETYFETLHLEQPRTRQQLQALEDEVGRAFKHSEELRRDSLSNGGRLNKKYFEEVYPLTLLANHLFVDRHDVLFEPNLDDSKSFDATIHLGSPEDKEAIHVLVEFTYAKDGHDENLRMEELNKRGHVSLVAPIEGNKGTKSKGRHIAIRDDVAMRRDSRLKCYLDLILDRIRLKASLKYKSVDLLVVVFDDLLGFREPAELLFLKQEIACVDALPRLCFKKLLLLGSTGSVFLEFVCDP